MKTPSTLAILMASILEMAHRERIVLKCNTVTDSEFQQKVSMEIYATVQHERVDQRKNLRISYVDSVGKPVPSSKVFNKFEENLDEAFLIENVFNKVSEELLEVPKKEVEEVIDETPVFESPVAEKVEVVEETPAEILSSVATEEKPKKTSKPKVESTKTKSRKVVETPKSTEV